MRCDAGMRNTAAWRGRQAARSGELGAGARPRRSCAGARSGGDTDARSTGARNTAVLRLQEEDDDFAENPLLPFSSNSFISFLIQWPFWDFNWGTKAFYKNLKIFM